MQLFEIFSLFSDQRYLHYIILLIYIILGSVRVLVGVGHCWSVLVALVCIRGIYFKFSCFLFFFSGKLTKNPSI